MVKRKQKKVLKQKQKQKQNVRVNQNVKVVIGDVKRKRAVKSSGTKALAKPPIVLNISNPQPQNNMFMEYFKQQLQNQQPIHASTLRQNEIINEREENKASRAGALHNLDQEPDDVARELRRQRVEGIERFQQAQAEQKNREREMQGSIRKIPKQTQSTPKMMNTQKTPEHYFMPTNKFELLKEEETDEQEQVEIPARITPESMMLREMEQQRSRNEREIDKSGGAGMEEEETMTIIPKKRRGRKSGSKNKTPEQKEAKRKEQEEKRLAKEEKRQEKKGRKEN